MLRLRINRESKILLSFSFHSKQTEPSVPKFLMTFEINGELEIFISCLRQQRELCSLTYLKGEKSLIKKNNEKIFLINVSKGNLGNFKIM
jgi:hypothetical protein